MATKLKNMKLTSVDLVRAGANQEADICLYKSAEEEPTPAETNIFKRFVNWLRENHEETPQDDVEKYVTFKETNLRRENEETLWRYNSILESSLRSILEDKELSEEQKSDLMKESLSQYTAAMERLIGELTGVQVNKADPDIEELEEIEKFNPYHDKLGRFASANGATSFTYAPGKSKAHDLAIQRQKDGYAAQQAEEKKLQDAKPKVFASASATEKPKKLTPKDKDWVNESTQAGHPEPVADSKWINNTAKTLHVDKATAAEMQRTLQEFSDESGAYAYIRAASRYNGEGPKPPDYEANLKKAETLETYIQRSPKWAGGTLHRGITVNQAVADDILRKIDNGDLLDMQGVSSWSSKEHIAKLFSNTSPQSGQVGIIFKTSSTSTKKGTAISDVAANRDEMEVLMSNSARFKAVKVEFTGTKYIITVDEVE